FAQSRADRTPHAFRIDEVRIENQPLPVTAGKAALARPENLELRAAERHIDLRWDYRERPGAQPPSRFVVYRSRDGRNFEPIGTQTPGIHRFTDFLGKAGETAYYKVTASDAGYRESEPTASASATTRAMSDDELLTMLQEACFRYYWEGADPDSGM